jgi:phage tail-like protein
MASYYPPVGFHFKVIFEGFASGDDPDVRFQEVSGLNVSVETETYQEGGENRFSHRFPKPVNFSNITFKRGMLIGSKLIDWFRQGIEGFIFKPITVKVILMNENHKPLESWNIINAYPVKWNIDAFNAQDGKIVAETIELCYQYFSRSEESKVVPVTDPPVNRK